MLGQTVGLLIEVLRAPRQKLTPSETAEFSRVTLGLWGVNAVPPALGQINTLLVAAILGAEIAGAVFVAERTARLIDLPLNGINQVLAPLYFAEFLPERRCLRAACDQFLRPWSVSRSR